MSTTQSTIKTSLPPSQKEVRKYKKKARIAEERFNQTKDVKYLNERDGYNDKIEDLERNFRTNLQNQKKKQKNESIMKHKTDDQILNEEIAKVKKEKRDKVAMNEIQEKQKIESDFKKQKTERRNTLAKKKEQEKNELENLKKEQDEYNVKMKEEKKNFMKDFLEGNPTMDQSDGHHAFVKFQEEKMKFILFKNQTMKMLIESGMTPEIAEENFKNYIENMKKN
jgi:hypothetical protein